MANVPRARRGTLARGRSEARTPGCRVPGSGIASIPAAAATLAPSSSHHTRRVGAGPYWASTLDPSAPAPSPRRGAAVVISGASPLPSGCRSISAAPSAPVAVPTPTPCSARAANSDPTSCAARNTAHAPAVTTRAARITRRRPR
jgi:hypothetical protein